MPTNMENKTADHRLEILHLHSNSKKQTSKTAVTIGPSQFDAPNLIIKTTAIQGRRNTSFLSRVQQSKRHWKSHCELNVGYWSKHKNFIKKSACIS